MSLEKIGSVQAHAERVWDLSTHSGIPLLASCSSDKTCKLFDISNGIKEVSKLDEETHSKSIRSVQFKYSKDNTYPTLALGSFDSTSSIWGADDFKSKWELLAVVEGHENEVKCVDWSIDGKFLSTCARDKSIWIWETDELNEEFECVAVLSEHEGDVKFVNWNDKGLNDDHTFISGSYDDTLRVWRQDSYDEDEWNCVANLSMDSTVWSATWINNNTILCGLDDGRVIQCIRKVDDNKDGVETDRDNLPSTVKDVEDWIIDKVWSKHEGSVYSVSCKDDTVVSGGSDGVIRVYNLNGDILAEKRLAHGTSEVNVVAVVKTGVVASGGDDGVVALWKV